MNLKGKTLFKPAEPGCVLSLTGLPGGGNKIYDSSPYGNMGTITGATWTRLACGLWGLNFDGTDDYVDCGQSRAFNIRNEVTIEAWICPKIEQQGVLNSLIGYNRAYQLSYHHTTGPTFGIRDASSNLAYMYAHVVSLNNWHHIVGIYNGVDQTGLHIYVNGNLDDRELHGTCSGQIEDSSGYPFKVSGISGRRFGGDIALMRVYNRALSALEIQNHFNREGHLFGAW